PKTVIGKYNIPECSTITIAAEKQQYRARDRPNRQALPRFDLTADGASVTALYISSDREDASAEPGISRNASKPKAVVPTTSNASSAILDGEGNARSRSTGRAAASPQGRRRGDYFSRSSSRST